MRKATSIEVLRSIAGIRLDGEPDAEGNDSEMDIDDAFRLLSDAVESARDAVSRDPIEHVRILREVCEDARKELEAQATYFGPHLDPENNLFRILRKLESVLEATKEA